MDVLIKEEDRKGAAMAQDGDQEAGTMTYSLAGDTLIIIDHTEVNSAYGGQGVGKQLLNSVVELARKQGKKILPLCPFAHAQFDKREDIQDVLR